MMRTNKTRAPVSNQPTSGEPIEDFGIPENYMRTRAVLEKIIGAKPYQASNSQPVIIIEYGWDWRAGVWCGVVRNRADASAHNLNVLRMKLRHELGDTIPKDAVLVMRLTGPDKPRPT